MPLALIPSLRITYLILYSNLWLIDVGQTLKNEYDRKDEKVIRKQPVPTNSLDSFNLAVDNMI